MRTITRIALTNIARRPATALRLAAFLSTLALLALLAGCDQKSAQAPSPPPPPRVNVARPVVQSVTDYLEFTGNTRATETVELRARVEGYLKSVNFKDGSLVRKGDLLFEIEPQTYEASLRQAQADLASQQSRLSQAETELARSKKLLEAKAGPETDVTKWTQERDSAKAAIATAKARIDVAQINLSYTRVTAPFDGRIGRRMVDPGNLVGAGDRTVVATLIRQDPMFAYFTLNERDFLRLRQSSSLAGFQPGQQGKGEAKGPVLEMALSGQQDFSLKGRLDFQDLGVDPQTGTIQLRGIFPNTQGAIVPGLFVRIRTPLEVKDALLVPETAVGVDQLGNFVLVANAQNVAEQKRVQAGSSQAGKRVILGGLAPDDRVIVTGLQMARPGTPVTPMEEGQQGQPGQPAAQAKQ